jgi:hypothetical protein
MAAISEIIFNSTSHSNLDQIPISVTGDKAKGAGYYGFGHSFHTVEIELNTFVGTIKIQGTLATDPQSNDWFDVNLLGDNNFSIDTTGLVSNNPSIIKQIIYSTATTSARMYNFTGNFTWVRIVIENWTAGSINRVLLNH